MLGYLSLNIICSSKLTVFLELRSRKTVRFSEQIMSADKYPSLFSRQMEAIVYISRLSVPSKILCRVLIDKVKSAVDMMVRQQQAEFLSGRGTSEQIFVLWNIREQCQEWQAQAYINFLDFSNAFDCVIREGLWGIMGQYGLRNFQALHHCSSSCVTEGGRYYIWLEVKSGVRQGCVLSGFIFVLIIDWVVRHTNDRRRSFRW